MFLFHPTASSAHLSGFPEFWLKVYLHIFVEQAGNGSALRVFRGRCGLVETNQSRRQEQTPGAGQSLLQNLSDLVR